MSKLSLIFSLFIYVMLASCDSQNGSGNNKSMTKNKSAAEILGDSNYLALCYGGYRTNTRDSQPTIAQIKEDMKLISATGVKIVRTYNTKYAEINNLLEAISDLKQEDPNFEMYVMLGVWIRLRKCLDKSSS